MIKRTELHVVNEIKIQVIEGYITKFTFCIDTYMIKICETEICYFQYR